MCNARRERGQQLAERVKIVSNGERWIVPSATGQGKYSVWIEGTEWRCTCPDFQDRQQRCKHAWAVTFSLTATAVTENADGTTTVETATVEVKRKTYKQPDWSAYHAHQVNERRHFLTLLANLCATIPEPERTKPDRGGQRPLSVRDAIYAAVFKVYSLSSARRFSGELAEAHEAGYIGKCPHFNSVLNVFDREETTPILKGMLHTSALPLKAVECDWAVDSTGFATTKYTSWFDHKWGKERRKANFVKAHIICGVRTNVVPAVEILSSTRPTRRNFPRW